MSFELIFLDLDGTLTNDEKVITEKTRRALMEAQNSGIRLVLASARPAPGLYRECDALSMRQYNGILMSYNGGSIASASSGEVFYKTAMKKEQARKLLSLLSDLPVTPILDDGAAFIVRDKKGYKVQFESQNNCMPCREAEDLSAALTFDPVKILLSMLPEHLPSLQEEIRRRVREAGMADISVVQTAPFYLELIPSSIHKGKGLSDVCRILGVSPLNTLAFGDSENDIPMLRQAGIGVAMGNAAEQVRSAADFVTLDNNSDGIAFALERFIPARMS